MNKLFNTLLSLFKPKPKTLGDIVRENNRIISQRESEYNREKHLEYRIIGYKGVITKLKKAV